METQVAWGDRGHALKLSPRSLRDESSALLVVSRTASAVLSLPAASVWLVLRGGAEVECREGRYPLRAGDWLSLQRDERPLVQSGAGALVLGVALSEPLQAQSVHAPVFPGRGRLPARARRDALEAWRDSAAFARNDCATCSLDRQQAARILRLVSDLQRDLHSRVDRCPGRSLQRKRQVFARMQRAHLHLQGNLARAVRIPELSGMTNMSIWYFTKTFHAVYGESPQSASTRMRLEHAARLLSDTRWSVGEVGVFSGFENNCSFSRAFRAQFGMPPSLYRVHGGRLAASDANPSGMRRQAG